MKNKKIFYTLITIAAIVMLAQSTPSDAAGKAQYPNQKPLQPLPPDVYPNISGNTNSRVENAFITTDEEEKERENIIITDSSVVENKNKPSGIWWYILVFFLITISFVVYFKNRKTN